MIATLANSAWLASCIPEYLRFRRALGRVRPEQERVLRGILRRNQASAFGRRHGFSAIRTVRDYQRRVPLSDYDDYRARVARIAEGETQVLTCERVRLFEPTSGSSSPAKWIPYTASLKHEFQRGIRAWVADLFLHDADLLHGPGYWSVSPAQACEEVTPSGIAVGFAHDSEYVGGLQQRLVRSVMAVPSSVRHSRTMEAFWYTTLRHLVRRPDLRLISVWNPSFLTLLADQLSEHGDRLLDEEPKLKPALRARTAAERHALLWPRLRLISCWADGNSGPAARKLAALFPQARIRGKGLIATEGFVSLPWEACDGAVLAVRSHFLEFLPADSVGRRTRPAPTSHTNWSEVRPTLSSSRRAEACTATTSAISSRSSGANTIVRSSDSPAGRTWRIGAAKSSTKCRTLMSERIALHAALYHHRLLDYRPDERATLLEEQRQISTGTRLQSWLFDRLNAFVDKRLANDVERCLPSVGRPATHGLVQLR